MLKAAADSRWMLTGKTVGGRTTVKARLVDKGYLDPDLGEGLAGTPGVASLRPCRLAFGILEPPLRNGG